MSEVNKYMDDAFQKMSEDYKVTYDSSFWDEASSMLDNQVMDDAFQDAAGEFSVPMAAGLFADMDNAFMDDAFKSAADNQEALYDSKYFEEYLAQEADLAMADSFGAAASSVVATYDSAYWNDANAALEEAGLHYEYNSEYWAEAKSMLDVADRRVFFYRWSGVATILLLVSMLGGNLVDFTQGETQPGNVPLVETNGTEGASGQNGAHQLISGTEDEFASEGVTIENTIAPVELNLADESENEDVAVIDQDEISENNLIVDNSPIERADVERSDISDNDIMDADVNDIAFEGTVEDVDEDGVPMIPFSFNSRFIRDDERLWTIAKMEEYERDFVLEEENAKNTIISKMPVSENHGDYMTQAPRMIVPIEKLKLRPTHNIGIYGGLGLGREYGDPQYIDPNWRSNVGLEYTFSPARKLKRFEFGFAAGVNQMRHSSLGIEKRSKQYFENGTWADYYMNLRLTDLFYASGQFNLGFKLNRKNMVKVGVAYDRLIAVQSNMSYKVNSDAELVTVNNNWGVQDGVQKNDVRFSIGYEFAVTKRFAVQLNGSIGMFDRTDNIFLKNESFDREMNVSVGLKYNIFRKF